MCRHTSQVIRTRQLERERGKLYIIEHVKRITPEQYQGTYKSGAHWSISQTKIDAEKKTYRVQRIGSKCGCYRLVMTFKEVYRELAGTKILLGPMRRDLRGVPKKEYLFAKGGSITDLALNEDGGLKAFDVVEIQEKRFLRETKK